MGISMVSYRPVGVTILAAFIIFTYGIIFLVGLALIFGWISPLPLMWAGTEVITFLGLIILIWAAIRLSMGFGLLKMRRKAWKSAMGVFIIGLIFDFFLSPGQILLDIIIIVYLLIVKKHFIY
jgi:hypothetical protein